jgi:metal-responsive CopG/Arc/MetJ family transcriptional regulator
MTKATALTAATEELTEVTVSLPADVLQEIDQMAAEKGRTRSDLLVAGARRYLFSEQRWREVQAAVASSPAAAELLTEDDIEDYVDSLSDPD